MTGGDVEDEAALAWFWKSDEKDFFSVFDGGGEGVGGDGGSDDPPISRASPSAGVSRRWPKQIGKFAGLMRK